MVRALAYPDVPSLEDRNLLALLVVLYCTLPEPLFRTFLSPVKANDCRSALGVLCFCPMVVL